MLAPPPPPSLLIHAWVVVAVPMVGVAWRGALRDRAAPCRPLSRTYSLVTSADGCVDTTYDFKYVEYRKAPAPVTGCPAGAAVDRALCLGPAMYLQCKAECDARGYAGACAADYAASGIAALPAFCQYATGSRCAARFCASDHRWECTAECDALGIYRMPPPVAGVYICAFVRPRPALLQWSVLLAACLSTEWSVDPIVVCCDDCPLFAAGEVISSAHARRLWCSPRPSPGLPMDVA